MLDIFVPSRGRADINTSTMNYASAEGVALNIVVEPQEYEKYYSIHGNNHRILTLPENNLGISYARNYIKNYAEQSGLPFFWMLDDDINGLYRREGTRLIKHGFSATDEARQLFIENNVAIGAMQYRQYAWCEKKELNFNVACVVAVFFDVEKTKNLSYDPTCNGKEDIDICISAIRNKLITCKTSLYALNCPPAGKQQGGMTDIYYSVDGKEDKVVERLLEKYGHEIFKIRESPRGTKDITVLWNKINSAQTSLF